MAWWEAWGEAWGNLGVRAWGEAWGGLGEGLVRAWLGLGRPVKTGTLNYSGRFPGHSSL